MLGVSTETGRAHEPTAGLGLAAHQAHGSAADCK